MNDPLPDPERLREVEERLLADDQLLPSLPEVALRVQKVMEDEDVGIAEVAKVVQADPALSGRLVQVANAAQFSHMAKVTGIQAAIGRLGLRSVRNLALSFSLRNAVLLDKGPFRTRLQQAWRCSIAVGAVSYILATVTIGLEADRAMLGGLLHNVGELALIRVADALDLPVSWVDGLIASHGTVVAQRVLDHWSLQEFLPLIRCGEDWMAVSPGPQADYLDLLVVARYHAFLGTSRGEGLPPLTELPAFSRFPMLRLGPDMSIEVLRESQQKIAEIERLLS